MITNVRSEFIAYHGNSINGSPERAAGVIQLGAGSSTVDSEASKVPNAFEILGKRVRVAEGMHHVMLCLSAAIVALTALL